jgi:hypothetical protein
MEVILRLQLNEELFNSKVYFNFLPEAAESYWDNIEIQPVKEIAKGIYETTEEGDEDFWCVYLHQLGGGVKCIADVRSKKDAEKLANLILNAANYRVYSK